MSAQRLRELAIWVINRAAWLVPARDRERWRAQWHADVWYRCHVLHRTGLVNPHTAAAVMARLGGAVWHAGWLRSRSGGWNMVWHDVRHAVRSLKGKPGFTAIAVLTLAIGIGANSVIFSWIEATLLNPMPGVADKGSLAALYFTTATRNDLSLSYPNYVDIRDQPVPGVADIAVFGTGALSLRTAEGAERVWGEVVSGNLFTMLGVGVAQGRALTPDDDRAPGGHPVVMVSHAFWQRRLGGRSDVVGTTLTLNERAFTVVGVTAPGFHGTQPLLSLDVFLPVAMQTTLIAGDRLQARSSGWLQGLVRLSPGATLAEAQSSLDVVAARLAAQYPDVNAGRGLRLFELWRQPSGGTRQLLPVMAVLGGLVATLLALVCANMASLLLARANGRQREFAVRRSLGASRGQVVRLLMAESVVLALGAGLLASWVAQWSGALLNTFIPPIPIPIAIDAGLNLRVLAFSTIVSLGSGLILGLLPALQASSVDLLTPLKEGSGGSVGAWGRGRVRHGLIVVQVALALVLLVSAGLFVRALDAARHIDPGFSARNGLVASIDVGPAGYDETRGRQLFRRIADELRALPGVEAAAVGQRLPLTMTESSDRSVQVDGYTPAAGEEMTVYYASIGAGYFETLGMPLADGRGLSDRDDAEAPLVTVVNQTMARRYWPEGRAIGGRIKVGDRWAEVVGIARDAKYGGMSEPPRSFMYLPVDQVYRPTMRLMVRTTGSPEALVLPMREALRRVDPALPLFDVQTFEQHMAFSFFVFELAATLLGIFGLTATLLAALGLYGVVAQSVRPTDPGDRCADVARRHRRRRPHDGPAPGLVAGRCRRGAGVRGCPRGDAPVHQSARRRQPVRSGKLRRHRAAAGDHHCSGVLPASAPRVQDEPGAGASHGIACARAPCR